MVEGRKIVLRDLKPQDFDKNLIEEEVGFL